MHSGIYFIYKSLLDFVILLKDPDLPFPNKQGYYNNILTYSVVLKSYATFVAKISNSNHDLTVLNIRALRFEYKIIIFKIWSGKFTDDRRGSDFFVSFIHLLYHQLFIIIYKCTFLPKPFNCRISFPANYFFGELSSLMTFIDVLVNE